MAGLIVAQALIFDDGVLSDLIAHKLAYSIISFPCLRQPRIQLHSIMKQITPFPTSGYLLKSVISHCTRASAQSFQPNALRCATRPAIVRPARCFLSSSRRCFHNTRASAFPSKPPKSRDRGPKSSEETQTDFGNLDVLRNTAAPATAIDACTSDGFALNNQMRISGCGIFLVGGEAFRWRPWLRENRKEGTITRGGIGEDEMTGRLQNAKGQWDVQNDAWGILDLVWPKPGMPSLRLFLAIL